MHMPQLARQWTVDDVHALPDDGNRYEVIDGELFVTPAPRLRHQEAVVELIVVISRFSDHITRLEVHLADENGPKGGENDIRCTLEARLEGRQPMAVTHHAGTIPLAVQGAANSLVSMIDTALGRTEALQRAERS
jgi:hypothetical protein